MFALIAAVGAYGLWNRRIWGRRTTIAVTILNLVSSVPAVVAAPSGAIVVIGAVIVVVCMALLVQLWSKPLKDGMRTGATAA